VARSDAGCFFLLRNSDLAREHRGTTQLAECKAV
jgi:hypothetical protein